MVAELSLCLLGARAENLQWSADILILGKLAFRLHDTYDSSTTYKSKHVDVLQRHVAQTLKP